MHIGIVRRRPQPFPLRIVIRQVERIDPLVAALLRNEIDFFSRKSRMPNTFNTGRTGQFPMYTGTRGTEKGTNRYIHDIRQFARAIATFLVQAGEFANDFVGGFLRGGFAGTRGARGSRGCTRFL